MNNRWTIKDIERKGLVIAGNGFNPKKPPVIKIPKAQKRDSKEIAHIKSVLSDLEIEFVCELVFAPGRKYRFDIALLSERIAIEYEGIISEKSRHTTLTGFSNDCSKYNLAQRCGWDVLRYTALNYLDFEIDLKELLKTKMI